MQVGDLDRTIAGHLAGGYDIRVASRQCVPLGSAALLARVRRGERPARSLRSWRRFVLAESSPNADASCYERLVSVELPKSLLEVLVCPKSKAKLLYFPKGEANDDVAHGFLLCPTSRLRYRIEGGVPVMLVEEAQEVPSGEVDRLVARARELRIA